MLYERRPALVPGSGVLSPEEAQYILHESHPSLGKRFRSFDRAQCANSDRSQDRIFKDQWQTIDSQISSREQSRQLLGGPQHTATIGWGLPQYDNDAHIESYVLAPNLIDTSHRRPNNKRDHDAFTRDDQLGYSEIVANISQLSEVDSKTDTDEMNGNVFGERGRSSVYLEVTAKCETQLLARLTKL